MPIYQLSTLGIPGNQIRFNDDSAGVDPYFRAIRRRPTNRDVRNFDTPLPEDSGIADFKTLLGRTDYVLDGKMYPITESSYDQGRRALRRLADVRSMQEDPSTDQGYVPYAWAETDGDKQMFMKVLFVDLAEDSQNGLVQPFRLFCKVKYPVIFGTTLRVADTGPTAAVGVGTSGLPFLVPVLLGKTTYAVSATANNQGDIDAYPESIIITGPVNRPRFVNVTTGEFIEVDVNMATIADQLILTYDQDSLAVELNGVSVFHKLSEDSNLFKIPPGPSTFQLTGSAISAGASGIITFYDAFPLS